jgi:HEAT repeat protein
VATWLPLAEDPDSGVRLSALVALEPSRDERVLAVAREALGDNDAVVRAQAEKMLADRDDQESVPALIELLLDRNSRVRAVAHRALETLTRLELPFDTTDSEDARRGAVEAIRQLLGR